MIAPLIEEPAKALCLLALYRSREFDNATDGFVYGAAAGLGFGMTENFFYFGGPKEFVEILEAWRADGGATDAAAASAACRNPTFPYSFIAGFGGHRTHRPPQT